MASSSGANVRPVLDMGGTPSVRMRLTSVTSVASAQGSTPVSAMNIVTPIA
ncbi:hypothetical protein D3C83_60610 [compost metagenome]